MTSEAAKAAWKTCTSNLLHHGLQPNIESHHEAINTLRKYGLTRCLGLWAVRVFEGFVLTEVAGLLSTITEPGKAPLETVEIVANAHQKFARARNSVASLEAVPGCEGRTKHFIVRSSAIVEELATERFSQSVFEVLCNLLEAYEAGQQSLDMQRTLCAQLVDLGFSRVVEEAVSWVVFKRTDDLVLRETKGNLESRALPRLLRWVDDFLDRWITLVLPAPPEQAELFSAEGDKPSDMSVDTRAHTTQIGRWRKRLSFYLHEAVCNVRTEQLLKLIEIFPRSLPAIEDLKDCIRSTDEKPMVTRKLREQFKQKMLNAGTVTSEVLQQYVNMIRTLRILDPTGVILENVSDPVREYLRRRTDTVRCIVSEMTGDGDLYEELERGRPRKDKDTDGDVQMNGADVIPATRIRDHEDEDCLSIDGDYDADGKVDFGLYDRWEPDPIDAPYRDGRWNAGGDAIATLVTIYGSSEQIVNEYKGLLADKLVGNFDLDIDREARILQLLTERFGKEAMHDCSIMLKDVEESRETLQHANRKTCGGLSQGFEATVISKEFWPKLVEEPEFRLPDGIVKQMGMYGDSFTELKEPRKLRWQHGLGVVSITMEFEDGRRIEAHVTPLQATILSHFAERKRQDVRELQEKIGVEDESVFRRKIQGLASQGFIRAVDSSNKVYETVEEGGELEASGGEDDGGEQEEEEGGENKDSEMAVYETFIMAMLQNLKQLPLDKIHMMLKRFVQSPGYDKSQSQLAAFLGDLVDQGKIEVGAGMYRIKK